MLFTLLCLCIYNASWVWIEKIPSGTEQVVLFPNNSTVDDPVTSIRLLGERNTGTNWITAVLAECFPDVDSAPRLIRWKHWFQEDDLRNDHPRTLVIAMFRNPYEWVAAMRDKPHHAPSHYRKKWRDFVTTPWTFPRPLSDLAFANMTGPVCHENFLYRDIIACQRKPPELAKIRGYSGKKPQYEMRHDGSGEPYNNILELRTAKIHNFLGVKSWPWVSDVLVIQYEQLLTEGTAFLVGELEKATGLTATCKPQPPQPERAKRQMDQEFVDYLTEHIDWEAEKLIGYKEGEA